MEPRLRVCNKYCLVAIFFSVPTRSPHLLSHALSFFIAVYWWIHCANLFALCVLLCGMLAQRKSDLFCQCVCVLFLSCVVLRSHLLFQDLCFYRQNNLFFPKAYFLHVKFLSSYLAIIINIQSGRHTFALFICGPHNSSFKMNLGCLTNRHFNQSIKRSSQLRSDISAVLATHHSDWNFWLSSQHTISIKVSSGPHNIALIYRLSSQLAILNETFGCPHNSPFQSKISSQLALMNKCVRI